MRTFLSQLATAIRVTIRGIPRRWSISLAAILAIALAVCVQTGFLSLIEGLRQTLAGSGSPDIVIVSALEASSEISSRISPEQVALLRQSPGIQVGPEGPIVSPELYVTVGAVRKATGARVTVPLRGMTPNGPRVRPSFRLREGRFVRPGTSELVVSDTFRREFAGFELGSTVRVGRNDWMVVGVFDAGGSVYESELWADLGTVQSLFRRPNTVQTVRMRLENAAALGDVQTYNAEQPDLLLDVRSEQFYFARQSANTRHFIQYLVWPLTVAIALGAFAGAVNTLYASVSARSREIAVMRAVGFRRVSLFLGTLAESISLAILGALVGVVATWLIFDGFTSATMSSSFNQLVFRFQVNGQVIAQGVALALVVGAIAGVLPAMRSVRGAITLAVRE